MTETLRFAAIGLDHRHIYDQVRLLIDAGAECVGYHASADVSEHILQGFRKRFPQVPQISDKQQLLEDPSIQLIVTAAIPCQRADLGIEVMQHGKDYMSDKPGCTTLEQLAKIKEVQQQTGRIYSVCFSERFEVKAALKADELIKAGAIGRVVQTVGLGPHRLNRHLRPDWFFQREQYGGILCDIASHQIDQFLHYTDSTEAEIISSAAANYANLNDPELEDFGEIVIRSPHANGYIRVDWYTPDGLANWGDGRMTILGTDGYIELRKYVDIAGRDGTNHLFLVDNKETRYIDCAAVELNYGHQLIHDVLNRSETAMRQEHCFFSDGVSADCASPSS